MRGKIEEVNVTTTKKLLLNISTDSRSDTVLNGISVHVLCSVGNFLKGKSNGAISRCGPSEYEEGAEYVHQNEQTDGVQLLTPTVSHKQDKNSTYSNCAIWLTGRSRICASK